MNTVHIGSTNDDTFETFKYLCGMDRSTITPDDSFFHAEDKLRKYPEFLIHVNCATCKSKFKGVSQVSQLELDKPRTISPGIVLSNGETIYPTGPEWILAFALNGCQWAIDIIESGKLGRDQATIWGGDGI